MPAPFSLRAHLHRLAFMALAILTACSDDGGGSSVTDGTGSGTATGTGGTPATTGDATTMATDDTPATGSSTGDELPAECACLASDCGPSICTMISAGCPDNCPTDFMVDEAAVTCALEALRDGTPGTIDWNYSPNGGGVQEWGRISILADRYAIRGESFDEVICGGAEDTVRGPLRGPEEYAACLANPSAQERFECVRGPLAAVDLVCKPGYESCGDGE